MADSKISALSAAGALGGGEAIPGVQGGATVRLTPAQIATYTRGTLPKTMVATGDPGATSDSAAGYSAGSWWLNSASGVRWTCIDPAAGAALWVPQGAMDHPGYISGNHYCCQRASGAASNVTPDILYAVPIYVAQRVTIQALGVRVTSAAAGNARIGLYANAGSRPDAKLAEIATPISTGAAGTMISALVANQVLAPGLYWLVAVFSAACGVVQITSGDFFVGSLLGSAVAVEAYGTGSNVTGYQGSGSYAGLPSTFGTASVRTAPSPVLGFQVA